MQRTQNILVLSGGILYLVFAAFHFAFWHLLDWQHTLACLSTLNNTVMQMLNLCLGFYFLLMGWIYISFRKGILQNKLGRAILFLSGLLFLFRMCLELIFPNTNYFISGFLLVVVGIHMLPAIRHEQKQTQGV